MRAALLLTLSLFPACASAPHVVCSPPPMTVTFENRQPYGIAITYGGRVRSLRPRDGRVEIAYAGSTYQVETEWKQLRFGPYDQFGTLHVEVR